MSRLPRAFRASSGEAAAWAALAAAFWGRAALGFRWSDVVVDGLLAAALAGLLGFRVARLLPALRRQLGRRLGAPPGGAFFLLPLVFYLALLPWTSSRRAPDGDEPYYLLITHSLAYDFDADLADEYADGVSRRLVGRDLEPQTGDPVGRGGEIYSRHGVLLPLLLAPAYRVAGTHGALAIMAALTAALAWAFARAARHDYAAQPRAVLLGWAAIAFAPPLLVYAHQIWVEVPAALLVLVAWDAARGMEDDPRPALGRWLALVLPLAALPLLKLRFAAIALPLLALALVRAGPRVRRALLWAGGVFATLLALVLVTNWARYGNPLKYIHLRPEAYLEPPSRYLKNLLGLGFDSAFGLFPSALIWIASIAGIAAWARRRARPLVDAAVIFGPYLLAVASSEEWYGAWSPPFRYALVTLPFVGFAVVEALAAPRTVGARLTWSALVAATLALALLWIVVPGWTYHLADGTSHLTDALSRHFDADLARFAPSMVRPRLATWWVPLVILALVPLVWRSDFGLGRRGRSGRWVVDAGLAAALVAVPAWVAAAHWVPTGIVEFEDAQVRPNGGSLSPPMWTPARYQFRGGWALGHGDALRAPVVPGNRRLALSLDLQPDCAGGTLELGAASVTLERQAVPASGEPWSTVRFGPLEWPPPPAGRELVLAVKGEAETARCSVILDRAVLTWDRVP